MLPSLLRLLAIAFAFAALAVVPAAARAQDGAFSLTILHTNDTHAHHEPDENGNGGVARQAALMTQIAAEAENVLILDAGDRFTGTLYHRQYRGADNITLMNALGYDAMTLGNHEFDNGNGVLGDFLSGLEFPVVTANLDLSNAERLAEQVQPYAILDVNGQQVGVTGLITTSTAFTARPGDNVAFDDDYAGAVQNAVDAMTGEGVTKIVLLSHIGLQGDIDLAPQLTGVDIIVGGHTHLLLSNTVEPDHGEYPMQAASANGEPVLIVQSGENNLYLGRLDVTFDANGVLTAWQGDSLLLSADIAPDPEIEQIVLDLAAPIEQLRATVIGQQSVFLVGDPVVCHVQECTLGNLVTDALRAETQAQIAIINAGNITTNIPDEETSADSALPAPRDVTLGEVLVALPFGDLASIFELTGEEVVAALENGVSKVEESQGRFPQVSGIRYTFDASQDAGSRITLVEVLGEDGTYTAIDPAATYRVVSTTYLRDGGDDYTMFAENATNAYDYGRTLPEIVEDYITANSPIAIQSEARITRVDAPA